MLRQFLRPWSLALGVLAFPGVAAALPNCEGTYAATPLQPLPAGVSVGLDIHDASPENQRLAQQFLAGMGSVGVAVGGQPTVLLHVTASILGGGSSRSSYGAEEYYPGLSAFQGGMNPAPPVIPRSSPLTQRSAPAASLLIVRIDATEAQSTRVSWVASVQCQRTGGDDGQLAYELGRVIGATLGQRIERRRL